MASPLVLSGSSITTFLRCGKQWYFAYIEGIKSPPTLKQVVGIATHAAVETNMRQKVDTKIDLPTADVVDAFITSYDQQLPDVDKNGDDDPGESKDSGVAITKLYQEKVAPDIQPLWVEREIQFAVDGQPYSGVIDLVEERPGLFGAERVIRDTKTTGRKPAAGGSYGIAMTGYALAYREQTGDVEADIVLDYLVRTKTPQYVPINSGGPVEDDTIKQFGSIVGQVAAAVQAGSFLPNGIQNNSCGWCGYRDICSDYKRMNK